MAIGNINQAGRIVFDPELKFSPNGNAVWKTRVVFSRKKKSPSGEWVDNGSPFLDVVAFGDFATNLAEAGFAKGDNVIVIGQLKQDEYEKDGQKRVSYSIILDEFGKAVSKFAPRDGQQRQQPMSTGQVADAFGGSVMDDNSEPPF